MSDVNRPLYEESDFDSLHGRRINADVINVEEAVKNVILGNKNMDVSEIIEPFLGSFFTKLFVKDVENSFKNSFISIESLCNEYSKNKLQIELRSERFTFIINSEGNNLKLNHIKLISSTIANIDDDNNNNINYSHFYKGEQKQRGIVSYFSFLYFAFTAEVYSYIDKVYFLPSSRSGLYQALSTFSSLLVELSKSRNFLTNKVELPNISEPVSDYFLNLSNIKNESNIEYDGIIEYFENEILKGNIVTIQPCLFFDVFRAESEKMIVFFLHYFFLCASRRLRFENHVFGPFLCG
jgi:hypothetical protein